MKMTSLIGACLALAVPFATLSAAQAQGIPGGAAHGFNEGNRIAGPVGAVVGTAVGGVIGGVEGVLGINHEYVAYQDAPPPAVVHHYRHHRRYHHYRPYRHHH